MHICSIVNQLLENVDERLDNNGVQEFSCHGRFLFVGQRRIVVIVIGLVSKFVEDVRIRQLVQSSVRAVNERLLIDLVLDCNKKLVVVSGEGSDEGQERSQTRLIQAIDGFRSRWIILEERFKDMLIFNIENLILESKQ